MKFLVTGSAGLVGSQVTWDLAQTHTVYSAFHETKPDAGIPTRLDLLDPQSIRQSINDAKPDAVIHLAAMTNVDLCETKKELATQINSDATGILARQASATGAFFVYVSTDYVFDGKTGMKKEPDAPNPVGHYGASKLGGEKTLNSVSSGWCIARTSTPFGIHKTKKSFPVWVKESLESKKEISVLTDQLTSPTHVSNLSRMLIEIATRQISGIIHVAGATRISRYDLAVMVADKLNLDKSLIKKTTLDKMSWTAKRPQDSSLDVSLATRILDEKPQTIQESLDLFLKEIIP